MMETVCAEKLMMPKGIIDLIVHDGLAGLGHKGMIWWYQQLGLRADALASQ
jgi:hypothetical protein